MKASSWKLVLVMAAMALIFAACAPAETGGAGSPTTAAGGDAGAAPTTAAGGDAGAAPTTAAAGGDTGAANCVGVDIAALMSSGEALYTDQCAGCHGAQGEGQGNFPALAGNANVTGEDVAGLVQGYFAVDAHPKDISPDDLAGMLTYARGAFGNTAAVVCPTDVTIPAP